MKKIITKVAICVVFCVSIFSVTGCQQVSQLMNPQALNQASNSVYFSSLESCISALTSTLSNFDTYVSDGNVDGMKTLLEDTQTSIDSINSLDVPDSCKQVHQSYCDGLCQLQNVLSDYIQIYSDYKSGSIDYSVLLQRVNDAQVNYNNAITKLQEADKLASDIGK